MHGLRRVFDLWWGWIESFDDCNVGGFWLSTSVVLISSGVAQIGATTVYGNTTPLAWLLAAALVAMMAGELEAG